MSLSTLFSFRRKSLKLTEATTTLKGQYLGNVSTNVAKGEKCVDRPLTLLWTNYEKTSGKQTVAMKITVDNSGLKVYTTNQGLTHYWCHRISYFRVAKNNPKLFVWIYRHVGKKLKVELRCHAILLVNEKKASSLVELLTEKVTASLQEYRRDKMLKHRRRLVHEKAAAHLSQHGESPVQARTKLLATSKNYKPPSEYTLTSPTLTAISEEADCSSSDELDYNHGSPYSTLGRWTFKNKFKRSGSEDIAPDVNMNQIPDDECDAEYDSVNGFATLPRKSRNNSNRRLQKKLLVDRLETLAMQSGDSLSVNENGMSDSPDDFEIEPGSDEEVNGADSHQFSGADAIPLTSRISPISCSERSLPADKLVEHDDDSSDSDSVHDLSLTSANHPPSIAHIRSFSDGFYSFDRSSISSEGSEISVEKQKIFLHSKNHVSSESGVDEDIGSTETLSKEQSPAINGIKTAEESEIADEQINTTVTDMFKTKLNTNDLPVTENKMSSPTQSSSGIFYTPKTNSKNSNPLKSTRADVISPQPLTSVLPDKDFESDCSDSSVEVVRIVTRL